MEVMMVRPTAKFSVPMVDTNSVASAVAMAARKR